MTEEIEYIAVVTAAIDSDLELAINERIKEQRKEGLIATDVKLTKTKISRTALILFKLKEGEERVTQI